ncbi:EF-Hand 1, calcium-binding site [Nannochloropsis gaditana]|uniref:EF-Hand 1, calcium-binding site n=1 Tax=Nannochloropsis gaditana TaxID=72520 RepID=W7TVN6_9STRA|nr:EF-Hand 1, calcium-binding site [Nannochloropsis gaditana]
MASRRGNASYGIHKFFLVSILFLVQTAVGQQQQQLHRYPGPGGPPRRRPPGPNAIELGKENKRATYTAIAGGVLAGYWLSGWNYRSKNKKMKQKYERDLAHQEKRVEDAIRSVRQQYEDVLERKQEEYVEKYKHLQYIENAMGEAGIPVDLSMVSPSASLQQDYAEFKQPDLNGDDKITRREFDQYMRQYLAANPEYSKYDYPSFDEFDKDGDNAITFAEWQQYIQDAEAAALAQEQLMYQQQKKGKMAGRRR